MASNNPVVAPVVGSGRLVTSAPLGCWGDLSLSGALFQRGGVSQGSPCYHGKETSADQESSEQSEEE